MSAIHMLLRVLIPAVLLSSAGWGAETASVSFDNPSVDTVSEAPAREPEIPPEEEAPVVAVPRADTIGAVTVSYRDEIRRMKRQNRDVAGWLHVPGTRIDDVVLQNPDENNPFPKKNEYYLNRDFSHRPDKNGLYCLDFRATLGSREELDRVTTIYGHSWDDDPDGTLFSQLKKYRSPEFARENPYIFFSTEQEDMAWEVFAVFDTTIYLPYVRPRLASEKYYQVLDTVHELSYYNYDVAVSDDDRLLALSTCTFSVEGQPSLPEMNEYRFVIMARLMDPSEIRRDEAVFSVNDMPLLPDTTRALRDL